MTREQQYFLSIIKEYVGGLKTEPNETVDWQKLFDYSQSHQLTAIIYHQCKEFIPAEFSGLFRSESLFVIYSNANRRKITNEILNELRANSVNCFLIKGFDIAAFYPNWQYRTMGDTDIVVDDPEKAHGILLGGGFEKLSKIKGREYQYSKQDMEFELHDRLVYEEAINLDSTTDFLNDFKGFVVNGKLDDSFHFVFVINHLRKHFMNSGAGFRQFADVAVMVKNDAWIDWKWTEDKLKEIGLLPFAKTVFYYIDRWFGVSAPITPAEVPEDVFEASTDYIFDNGVFGFDNEDNKNYLISNTVRQAKFPGLAMMVIAVKKVFPSYKSMAASEHYGFLRGRPYLLPAAWIYRLFRGTANKGIGEGKRQISESFVSTEYIAERERMFRNWGLE